MATFKPPSLPILDVGEEDEEFLSQLEAAEAEALSLSASKRRRISLTSSSIPSPSPSPSPAAIDSGAVQVKLEQRRENVVEEGAYTAALKGSKSLTWQKQSKVTKSQEPLPRAAGGACYKCGKDGHWAKDCGQSSTALAAVEKCCPCGLGSCLLLTANTERNRGRKFFRCPLRQENGGCGFFEWCDESSGNSTSAEDRAWKNGGQQPFYQRPAFQATSDFTKSRNEHDRGTNSFSYAYGAFQKSEATDNTGYGMKTNSSCFKCGKEGHWARDCPNPAPSNLTPSYAGMKGNSSSSGTCYKCGQSGHWAKDCSQTLGTKPWHW